MGYLTWKQVATICATVIVTVWSGVLFLNQITGERLSRMEDRHKVVVQEVVRLNTEVGQVRADIIRVKCQASKDLCKEP